MQYENRTRNVKMENHIKNIPGFHIFMNSICNQLVEKELLDFKQVIRLMKRPDDDLVKFKKLVLLFIDRGTKSLEFLFVLRKIHSYPEFSNRVRKIVDDFVDSLKSNTSGSSRMKLKGLNTKKRSNDFDQSGEYQSTKRSKSEMHVNSSGSDSVGGRDVSRRTEQKTLNRMSCPASIPWENHTYSLAQAANDNIPLQENLCHDGTELKPDHICIGMPSICDQMVTKPLLSESKENLSDIENVKVLDDISGKGKIQKKKKKSFAKKLRALGVMVALGTVAYMSPRLTEMASNSTFADITKNASYLENFSPNERVDIAINTFERKSDNSSMYEYQFSWV